MTHTLGGGVGLVSVWWGIWLQSLWRCFHFNHFNKFYTLIAICKVNAKISYTVLVFNKKRPITVNIYGLYYASYLTMISWDTISFSRKTLLHDINNNKTKCLPCNMYDFPNGFNIIRSQVSSHPPWLRRANYVVQKNCQRNFVTFSILRITL
jgi:hypothetical protein